MMFLLVHKKTAQDIDDIKMFACAFTAFSGTHVSSVVQVSGFM